MSRTRRLWPLGVALVSTLIAAGLTVTAAPAQAATSSFRGVNWDDERDNFVDGVLILGGLSTSDSYATTQAKADRILSGLQTNLGANTVRMPVNYPTVSGSYWNSYTGAIDMATSKGMRVILSYWESASSRNGLIDASTANSAEIKQYACGTGTNQQWTRTAS
jgi:endoglucanase